MIDALGSVLICPFRKFWVSIFVIAFFAVPQIASGVRDDGFYLDPGPLVYSKRFSALDKSSTSNLILFDHLAPHQNRYEGIDGDCHERQPRRFLYGFLSGVLALIFGLRISYCYIVKGNDRAYFYGFIGWRVLVILCFLSNMFGFGALLECAFYFANPCPSDNSRSILGHYHAPASPASGRLSGSGVVRSPDSSTAVV